MRVLVIRSGALGDLVYATSVIDALRYEYGNDTVIDFVTTPGTGAIFAKDERVSTVFPLKHRKLPVLFSKEKQQIIRVSKENPYDILINFEFGKQFQTLIKQIHAKKKTGANIDIFEIPSEIRHAADTVKYCYKNVISQKNYQISYPHLIGTDSQTILTQYHLPQRYIIISPSNSHQGKKRINYRAWENEKWRELTKKLSKHIPVVMIGAPHEEHFFSKLKPYPDNVFDLVGKTPLPDLIGVIASAKALVSTDTGTAHIASAVNTETFTLIGPTPADVTGPYKTPENKVNIISLSLPCSPCYKTDIMKKCQDNICMKQITVDMVYDKIVTELALYVR